MTPQATALVRASWTKIKPLAEPTAQRFYGRLFARHPETQPLFQAEMAEQRRKFLVMLETVVDALDDLDALLPALEDLGAQHACYGVTGPDYDKLVDALLWTLGQALGDDFTPEVQDAWTEVYTTLAGAMQDGAAEQLVP
ncbi:hemin receptor [Thiorhodococcus mannitoliphagus]|uniref:Hemin receptor n=1 Tax=Thiorhodococcus mannitoliphagus TaxID=329406 RepID=A0A6P1E293_9GAMM|nr:globin domain-containing protein [Thiorhodococcus mannitoliphagus]NEX23196.1 hemin receptor [Thiorhodococcus mannitoliphagus]